LSFAHGAFTQNITITTVYDTLGPEGLSHALTEGDTTHLYTSMDLLPSVSRILKDVPSLTHVIFNGKVDETIVSEFKTQHSKITLLHLTDVIKSGTDNQYEETLPEPDDLACIMYTSGTTGNPKVTFCYRDNLKGLNIN
jgi:long-chain acyl-CoA synthetase